MDQKQHDLRNFRQNILITLLSFSAVFLLIVTQITSRSAVFSPTAGGASMEDSSAGKSVSLIAPVRVAVSGSYGRYGSITLTTSTASEEFSQLGPLLSDVLNTAQGYIPCTQEEFFSALDDPSVYYDFLTALPLSILAELVNTELDASLSARYLVITVQNQNRVFLYLQDDADRCFSCPSTLSPSDLDKLIGQFEQGNALFAFECEKEYADGARSIHPLSLFLPDAELSLPVLQAENTLALSGSLLSALSFNPYTQTRWTEGSGTEVVVDGDRTLRLENNGTLSYRSGGSSALTLGNALSLSETVTETLTLLNHLLPDETDAGLYLTGISTASESTTMTFSYQYQGIPIRLAGEESAAQVTVSSGAVSSITMTCRAYHAGEETGILLPLRQALAIASSQTGAELLIGYADFGDGTAAPQWLCE